MKKLIPILSWFSVRIFQAFLLVLAIDAFEKSYELGDSFQVAVGDIHEYKTEGFTKSAIAKHTSVADGYNGGALAMSIITCMCLFLIVWVEINFSSRKRDKNQAKNIDASPSSRTDGQA